MDKLIEPEGWRPKYNAPIRNWYKSPYSGREALMCHEMESIPYIQEAVGHHSPEIIIETGTAAAGFTLVLHEAKTTALLYSFDLYWPIAPQKKISKYIGRRDVSMVGGVIEYQRLMIRKSFNRNVMFLTGDIYSHHKLLQALAAIPRRKLIYIDGGSKVKEVGMLAPLLNPGDMLGCHDWQSGGSIDYGQEGVAKALEPFQDHELNQFFIDERLRTRFFIR